MPPTVKRMKQTHRFFLVVGWATFDDGADEHLKYASADSVDDDRDENARKRRGHYVGKNCQTEDSRRSENMRHYHCTSVSDYVNEFDGKQIEGELHCEIYRYEYGDLGERDPVCVSESDK